MNIGEFAHSMSRQPIQLLAKYSAVFLEKPNKRQQNRVSRKTWSKTGVASDQPISMQFVKASDCFGLTRFGRLGGDALGGKNYRVRSKTSILASTLHSFSQRQELAKCNCGKTQ
jgi:hypothetical protein